MSHCFEGLWSYQIFRNHISVLLLNHRSFPGVRALHIIISKFQVLEFGAAALSRDYPLFGVSILIIAVLSGEFACGRVIGFESYQILDHPWSWIISARLGGCLWGWFVRSTRGRPKPRLARHFLGSRCGEPLGEIGSVFWELWRVPTWLGVSLESVSRFLRELKYTHGCMTLWVGYSTKFGRAILGEGYSIESGVIEDIRLSLAGNIHRPGFALSVWVWKERNLDKCVTNGLPSLLSERSFLFYLYRELNTAGLRLGVNLPNESSFCSYHTTSRKLLRSPRRPMPTFKQCATRRLTVHWKSRSIFSPSNDVSAPSAGRTGRFGTATWRFDIQSSGVDETLGPCLNSPLNGKKRSATLIYKYVGRSQKCRVGQSYLPRVGIKVFFLPSRKGVNKSSDPTGIYVNRHDDHHPKFYRAKFHAVDGDNHCKDYAFELEILIPLYGQGEREIRDDKMQVCEICKHKLISAGRDQCA